MNTLQTVRRESNLRPASRGYGGQASGPGLFGLPVTTVRFAHLPPATSRATIQAHIATGARNFFARAAAPIPAGFERNEIGELVPVAVHTPAMHRAAAFSEARLRSDCEARFRAAEARRRAGAGMFEATLAMEGN